MNNYQQPRFGQGVRHEVKAEAHPKKAGSMLVSIANCFPGEKMIVHFYDRLTNKYFDSKTYQADRNGYITLVHPVNWLGTPTTIVTVSQHDNADSYTHLD